MPHIRLSRLNWHPPFCAPLSFSATPPRPARPHARTPMGGPQILPGMVLQSDQLSTAVDNARRLLQLPRRRSGGDAGEGDRDELSPDQQQQQQHRRPSPTALRRASERLLLRFAARGGGGQRTGIIAPRSETGEKRARLLSLGADLRGSRAKVDPSPSKKGVQRR